MTGYTKLFGSILASTIWQESLETKVVWITLMAMANRYGIAEASAPGLAKLAGVPLDKTELALQTLLSTDKYSRTPDYDGRRIEVVDGGWRLLNHEKYREKMSKEDRAEYMRKYRSQGRDKSRRGKQLVTNGNTGNTNVTLVRQAEADSESEVHALSAFESLKTSIQSIYATDRRWNSFEESTLFDIARSPEAGKELETILAYRESLPPKDRKYFPQSVSALLSKWSEILDRAAIASKLTAAAEHKHTPEELAALERRGL